MSTLLTITWDMTRGLDLGFITLRYYSLLFALGFVLGYMLMKKIFRREGISLDKLDTLLTYVVVATILGARLGHVLFYEWDYYSAHPVEILKVWKGGLASHGAAIGIIIAIIIYCKKVLHKPTLWMLDRVVITIALAAALIRVGNWFNSEIYGEMENSNLQTVFVNPMRDRLMSADSESILEINFEESGEEVVTDSLLYPVYEMEVVFNPEVDKEVASNYLIGQLKPYINHSLDKENKVMLFADDAQVEWSMDRANVAVVEVYGIPRHPTQLYEAFAYLLIFLILYRLYLIRGLAVKKGFLFGVFLVLVFGFRFFIEYLKENQVASEQGQLFNTGQYLSIPLVMIGLYFLLTAKPIKEDE